MISKGNYEFLVTWKGYDDQTWEPALSLRSNKYLHSYLKQHNLVKLVLSVGDRKKYGLDQVDSNDNNNIKINNNKKRNK